MTFRVRTLPLILLVLLAPGAAAAESGTGGFGPFLGTWTSTPEAGKPVVTMTWEDRGDGIVFVSVEEAGTTPTQTEVFAFRQDGKDYPYAVRGGSLTSTIASKFVDARTTEITVKLDGQPAKRTPWAVAADGKTMTVGRPDGSVWRLSRQSQASKEAPRAFTSGYKRYIGVWEAIQTSDGANTGSVVWEDRGENFVVATVRSKAGEVTMRYSLKYDGKEYPCLTASSKGGIGTINSVFLDDYRTDWTLSSDGKRYNTGGRIVSPDARMMTVPITSASSGRDLVWRRLQDAPTDGILTR